MIEIPFSGLRIKDEKEIKTFEFANQKIEVLQYLPIEDKYDLVMVTLQNADEGDIYNPIRVEMYFNLYLVFMYSNINFSDKDREDLSKLYDLLEKSGIIKSVIELIPDEEYSALLDSLNDIINKKNEYRKSIRAMMENFSNETQSMQDMLNNFDKDKYEEVINFAKAANGGRDIN